ncbi:MAG: hypothetical protein DHS20C18_33400 [Saprospiraceae bacterium]|nr:MAG: hypothetical protein DHS20C18_33400 [Saprospiraceae bacterium]
MEETIQISYRFCGPPNSGNGGYVCGMLDRYTDYLSEVTLRKPIPLDKELNVRSEIDQFQLIDGEALIAIAKPGQLDLSVPKAPSFLEAAAAAKSFIGHDGKHVFPTCFVCGPDRHSGDGLRIFAGNVEGTDLFAAPWIPDSSLADETGHIGEEFLWAALDCPGAFAVMGDAMKKIVLGRMTAQISGTIKAGAQCVVIAWTLGSEGRKSYCGTAIYNEQQELCAAAKSVWFEI